LRNVRRQSLEAIQCHTIIESRAAQLIERGLADLFTALRVASNASLRLSRQLCRGGNKALALCPVDQVANLAA